MACKKLADITKVIGYVRVSTDEQSISIDAQRTKIQTWCTAHHLDLLDIHEDIGVSGGADLDKRPGLMAAIDMVGKGVGLMIIKRDRLARDTMLAAMIEQLVRRKSSKILTCDGISNEDTPEADMMRGMMDLFAQYERAIIKARTKTALAHKKARGELVGKAPYGMQVSADGVHLEANPREQAIIAQVNRYHAQGLSSRQISAKLAEAGMLSRSGTPFTPSAVINIVHCN